MSSYPQDVHNDIYPSDQGHDSSKTNSKEKMPLDAEKGHIDDLQSAHNVPVVDNGFGGGEGAKNFRNMSKWDTTFALLTNQVGLGVLSLPSVLKTMGISKFTSEGKRGCLGGGLSLVGRPTGPNPR